MLLCTHITSRQIHLWKQTSYVMHCKFQFLISSQFYAISISHNTNLSFNLSLHDSETLLTKSQNYPISLFRIHSISTFIFLWNSVTHSFLFKFLVLSTTLIPFHCKPLSFASTKIIINSFNLLCNKHAITLDSILSWVLKYDF